MINRRTSILALTATVLVGLACSSPETLPTGVHTPQEAINFALKEKFGVQGTYGFKVKNASVVNGILFLNSESNYRDPKCLTVRCDETATRMLTLKFGASPAPFFMGKSILVSGRPVRTSISLVENGEPTGLGYYQTHIRISNPELVVLCPQ